MSLLMPIINLRRDQCSYERYWRQFVSRHQPGNRNRLLLRSKAVVQAKLPPKTSKIKSGDVVSPLKTRKHGPKVEDHSEGSKDCKQEKKTDDLHEKSENHPSQVPSIDNETAADRPECDKPDVLQQEPVSGVTGASPSGGLASSIIRTSESPRYSTSSQSIPSPRYSSLVQGSTLGCIMQRIHLNDGDVSELDFSTLAQYNKRLGSEGCALVARSLATNHTVRKLVVRDHAIGDDGAIALSKMLCENTTLTSLELYGNNISDRGVEALAQALYGHDSLTYLCLRNNLITDRGAEALAKAIRCNCSLKSLELVHNRITWRGAKMLLDALDVNLHLETITLDANNVPTFVESQLAATLARNRAETLMHESFVAKERAEKLVRRASGCSTDDEDEDSSEEEDSEDYDNDRTHGIRSSSEVRKIPVSSSGLWI